MENFRQIIWLARIQIAMSLLILSTVLLVFELGTAIDLAIPHPSWMKIPFPHCQYEFINNKTSATWACRHAVDDEELVIRGEVDGKKPAEWGYKAQFKLTYNFDEAMEIRFLLDRCREGHTCPDYELMVNTSSVDCFYNTAIELAEMCFDRNYFITLFKAGPLVLKDHKSVENLHRVLVQYTKSLILYRILIEHGVLVGKYPGVITEQHPALGPVTGQLSPDFGTYPGDKDLVKTCK